MADVDAVPRRRRRARRRAVGRVAGLDAGDVDGGEPRLPSARHVGRHDARAHAPGRRAAAAAARPDDARRLPARTTPTPPGTGELPPRLDDEELEARAALLAARLPAPTAARSAACSGSAPTPPRPSRCSTARAGVPRHRHRRRRADATRSSTGRCSPGTLDARGRGGRRLDAAGARSTTSPASARGRPRTTCSTRRPGEVRFGDGVRGRAPQIGAADPRDRLPLRRRRAPATSPPKAIRRSIGVGRGVKVVEPAAAPAAAPTPRPIAAALERIPGELRRHDRAVTAGDFRELALATPGADVGPRRVPAAVPPAPTQTEVAAGVVSVVVWPRERPRATRRRPLPDRRPLAARLRAGSTRAGWSRPSCT